MTPTEKLTRPANSVGDSALAAFTGAVANSLALGLLSRGSWAGGIFLSVVFFSIGFLVLAFAGRPMACKLASEGRVTLADGLVLGAAIGSLTGALLTGILVSTLLKSPAAAFSIFTPLAGLFFGVVDGAVAGFTLVWLGRRKSAASGLEGAGKQLEARSKARLR